MPVVGFTIKQVDAKKDREFENSQISINSTPTIKTIKEIDVQTLDKKALLIDFDFITSYKPDAGYIKLSGEMIYAAEDNKKILDEWEKKLTLPAADSVEILNFLFRRCVLMALNLSDQLQLPPPVSMPFLKLPGQQEAPATAQPKPQKRSTEAEDETEKELKEKIKKLTAK